MSDASPRSSVKKVEIKFQINLQRLIEESPYNQNRREIWSAVGVSSAALSQYVRGTARPRFETLVALADFFGVTLDYLMLGRESPIPASDESNSVARYVDWALADIQSKVGRRSWLTARVGQLLSEKIDQAVEEASGISAGGMVTHDELLQLEAHSIESRLLTVHLGFDVIDLGRGDAALGRFAHVVATNLIASSPRAYKFLLPTQDRRMTSQLVHAFRRLLREELGVPDERLRLCEFRNTSDRVLVGACFYQLDMSELRIHQPEMALTIADYVTNSGWLGYSMNDNPEAKGEILMEVNRAAHAISTFDSMWQSAESLTQGRTY